MMMMEAYINHVMVFLLFLSWTGILSTAVSLDRGKSAQYTVSAVAFNSNNNQQVLQQQNKANITVTVHLGDPSSSVTASSNKKDAM